MNEKEYDRVEMEIRKKDMSAKYAKYEMIDMNGKEIKKMIKVIELLGVEIVNFEISRHLKLTVRNPATGTEKLVTVSKTPRSGGRYDEVRSSVRKVFRKDGEYL